MNLLEEPTKGQVFVGGTEVTDPDVDIDAVRRRVGMVFQQFNLFPHVTVTENLTLPQRRALERYKAQAAKIAAEIQRVAIARARHGPRGDAVRRADLGAGPGAGR